MRNLDIYTQSLTKDYNVDIFSKFVKAISQYNLIEENDKICVCVSGGKDSMLMAKLFSIYQKTKKINFEVFYLVVDPGYNKENLNLIKKNLELLNIDAHIEEVNIFEEMVRDDINMCYSCASIRRGVLYRLAKENNCNKIALGHHYDDVIATTLMNMLSNGKIRTMLPRFKSSSNDDLSLIRPLYLIRQDDIISWGKHCDLQFLTCSCKYAQDKQAGTTRKKVDELIKKLNEDFPNADKNIFASTSNVELDKIIQYTLEGQKHSMLD